jgi:hypothetical protein
MMADVFLASEAFDEEALLNHHPSLARAEAFSAPLVVV